MNKVPESTEILDFDPVGYPETEDRLPHGIMVGGFATTRAMLDKVGDVAVGLGIVHDFDAFTMWQADGRKSSEFFRLLKRAYLLTHSAGALAVSRSMSSSQVRDRHLYAGSFVAGPEPRSVSRLMLSASKKTAQYLLHPGDGRLQVLVGNNQSLLAHPYANLSRLQAISEFSTAAYLQDLLLESDTGAPLGRFTMSKDIFFANEGNWQSFWLHHSGLTTVGLEGDHDELLRRPQDVLSVIQHQQNLPGVEQNSF